MRKHYRNNKEDTYSVYCVSPRISVSANSQMRIRNIDTDTEYLDTYDEESGRWFCDLGCGFRYYRDAYDELRASAAIVDKYLSERRSCNVIRESYAVAWTYNYNRGVFSCDYELTEYDAGRKRSIQFSVGSVSMKALDEIDKAIHAWHITGEMIWDILFINLGDWEDQNSRKTNKSNNTQTEATKHPAQSAGSENDDELPF